MPWSRPSRAALARSTALIIILPAALAGSELLGLQYTAPGPTGDADPSALAPRATIVTPGVAAASAHVVVASTQGVTLGRAPDPSRVNGTDPGSTPAASSIPGSGVRHDQSKATGARAGRRAITSGVVSSVMTKDKEIAITIDDGGDPAGCSAMADRLVQEHVAATFFPIGRYVERSPDVWARIARHFPIGNHTAFHAVLTRLDDLHIRKQILADERFIRQATGKPPIHVLRPPGGMWDERVQGIAAGLGYRVLALWDVTAADTASHSRPQGMLGRALGGGPGSILLMHCNDPVSGWLLPRIIQGYRDRGYRFVTIPELLSGE
jgi:peptidoglycan-N-acetylglucosamine deacetylase